MERENRKQDPKTIKQQLKSLIFSSIFGAILPQIVFVILYKTHFKYALVIWYIFSACFLFATYKYCQNRHYLNFTKKKILRGFVFAILGLITLYIFIFIFPDARGSEMTKGAESMESLFICILGPIWEEIIFRGIILTGIFNNSFVGIIVSSALFSICHGIFSPILIFYFLMGIMFSLENRGQGDLSTSITTHVIYNTFSVALSFL